MYRQVYLHLSDYSSVVSATASDAEERDRSLRMEFHGDLYSFLMKVSRHKEMPTGSERARVI